MWRGEAAEEVPGLEAWAAAIASCSPEVKTVTLLLNRSRANVAIGESERLLVGDGTVRERVLGLEFEASSGTFLQTNSLQAATLYQCALDELYGLGFDHYKKLEPEVNAVALDEIKRVAAKYFRDQPFVLATVRPPSSADATAGRPEGTAAAKQK